MAKQYIQLYFSYLDAIEPLSDAERGRLFTACLQYSKMGAVPELCGNERFIFPMMRAQIDRDNEAYDDKCRKNSENRQQALRSVDESNDRQRPSTDSTKGKEKKKEKNNEKDREGSKKETPGASSVTPSKRQKNNYESLINGFTDDEGLRTALWAYIQMRVKKKAAPTDHALELVLKHLAEMSQDIAGQIVILNQSTVSNWTDIYPLRENNAQSAWGYVQPPHKETRNERNNRLIAEQLAKEEAHDSERVDTVIEYGAYELRQRL